MATSMPLSGDSSHRTFDKALLSTRIVATSIEHAWTTISLLAHSFGHFGSRRLLQDSAGWHRAGISGRSRGFMLFASSIAGKGSVTIVRAGAGTSSLDGVGAIQLSRCSTTTRLSRPRRRRSAPPPNLLCRPRPGGNAPPSLLRPTRTLPPRDSGRPLPQLGPRVPAKWTVSFKWSHSIRAKLTVWDHPRSELGR